jgi:hypothetical protein
MLTMDLTVEELAHESIELLPERDTMQPTFIFGNSIAAAVNLAAVDQSGVSGTATATVNQTATATSTATTTITTGDITVTP